MKKERRKDFLRSLMLVAVTAIITCILTTMCINTYVWGKNNINAISSNGNIFKTLSSMITDRSRERNTTEELESKMSEIKEKLEELYIGDIDEQKMKDGAIEGYVASLGDQYTEYLTEDEIKSLMEDVNGSYVGVGLYIGQNTETNEIVVLGVIEDSPGNKAGILVGDIIKKIDGEDYSGEQVTQASNKMKGTAGTNVKVTVVRDGEEIEVDITRAEIKFKCISYEKMENDIGYIKISSFDGGCAEDFKLAYKDLNSQGIKSLVIDLRNNGGGLVDQALSIAETIVPKGKTMLITSDKSHNETVSTSKEEPIINVPIVILVNGYTASASEILTAAVKENIDCKVIGTKTYGKGIIQGIYLLDDNKTGMKITIQEYFTPNHNKIHKVGITPDIGLELPETLKGRLNIEKSEDNQLNKAIEELKR